MSISRILLKLQTSMQKKPLLMNAVIYGSFYTGAEFVRQTYSNVSNFNQPRKAIENCDNIQPDLARREKVNETIGLNESDPPIHKRYNWVQLKRYVIYGCFIAGPILHTWYKFLDGFYKGKSMNIIIKKLLVDQFILTPPLLVLFFTSMSIMEGKSNVLDECKSKFLKTFQTSCMFWLPVQFVNFALVPAPLRVSFVSLATFCWANILCYLKSVPLTEETLQSTERLR